MSTGIVFSAFRPDLGLVETVVAARDGHQVIVVDDGSGHGYDHVWTSIEQSGARVLRLSENVGIAAALNAGIRAIFDGGATGAVTLDQDSTIGPGFVRALERAGDDARRRGEAVGVGVPEYFAGVSQVVHRRNGVLLARHSIQSGMLIPRETADTVGLLREVLCIDLVDTEVELRITARGLVAIAAPGLARGHSLGSRYERRLLGRRVRLPGVPDAVWMRCREVQVVEEPPGPRPAPGRPSEERPPDWYADAFAQVQAQLRAGNSYEVNLTYREALEADVDPLAVYHRLRSANPAPYAGMLRHHDTWLLSASSASR